MDDDDRGAPRFRFRKRERIRTRREIGKVFDSGSRLSGKGMRLHVMPSGGAETRAVFITARKYGNSIARNRARRVVSESWRLRKDELPRGLDVIVMIYPGEDTFAARSAQLEALLRRGGLLSG